MTLVQPIDERLARARHVPFVGAGGGYDVFGAVPLAHALRERGVRVSFAGVTFTSVSTLPGASPHRDLPQLYPVTGAHAVADRYCPEAWLARWIARPHGGHPRVPEGVPGSTLDRHPAVRRLGAQRKT